jgi:hypothetical protein
MRKQKNFMKTVICVNGVCFEDSSSATRHLLGLASQKLKVTVSRQVEEVKGAA